jgi:hypothetical protein
MCRYLHSRSRLGNRHSIILYTILPGSTGRGATASATDPHALIREFPRLRPVTDAMRAGASGNDTTQTGKGPKQSW